MTKQEHKRLITIVVKGSFKIAYYLDIYCGQYTKSWKTSQIKEDVYRELKERGITE